MHLMSSESKDSETVVESIHACRNDRLLLKPGPRTWTPT